MDIVFRYNVKNYNYNQVYYSIKLDILYLNMGEIVDDKTKVATLVNDIEMPPWAKNAYIFVKKHRELLESIEISEKINEWFNLIFGSKQKGKTAKVIGNYFIR